MPHSRYFAPMAVGIGFVVAGLYLLVTHYLDKGSPPGDWPDWVDQRTVGLFVTTVGALLVAVAVA
jgi:hypothetical protein